MLSFDALLRLKKQQDEEDYWRNKAKEDEANGIKRSNTTLLVRPQPLPTSTTNATKFKHIKSKVFQTKKIEEANQNGNESSMNNTNGHISSNGGDRTEMKEEPLSPNLRTPTRSNRVTRRRRDTVGEINTPTQSSFNSPTTTSSATSLTATLPSPLASTLILSDPHAYEYMRASNQFYERHPEKHPLFYEQKRKQVASERGKRSAAWNAGPALAGQSKVIPPVEQFTSRTPHVSVARAPTASQLAKVTGKTAYTTRRDRENAERFMTLNQQRDLHAAKDKESLKAQQQFLRATEEAILAELRSQVQEQIDPITQRKVHIANISLTSSPSTSRPHTSMSIHRSTSPSPTRTTLAHQQQEDELFIAPPSRAGTPGHSRTASTMGPPPVQPSPIIPISLKTDPNASQYIPPVRGRSRPDRVTTTDIRSLSPRRALLQRISQRMAWNFETTQFLQQQLATLTQQQQPQQTTTSHRKLKQRESRAASPIKYAHGTITHKLQPPSQRPPMSPATQTRINLRKTIEATGGSMTRSIKKSKPRDLSASTMTTALSSPTASPTSAAASSSQVPSQEEIDLRARVAALQDEQLWLESESLKLAASNRDEVNEQKEEVEEIEEVEVVEEVEEIEEVEEVVEEIEEVVEMEEDVSSSTPNTTASTAPGSVAETKPFTIHVESHEEAKTPAPVQITSPPIRSSPANRLKHFDSSASSAPDPDRFQLTDTNGPIEYDEEPLSGMSRPRSESLNYDEFDGVGDTYGVEYSQSVRSNSHYDHTPIVSVNGQTSRPITTFPDDDNYGEFDGLEVSVSRSRMISYGRYHDEEENPLDSYQEKERLKHDLSAFYQNNSTSNSLVNIASMAPLSPRPFAENRQMDTPNSISSLSMPGAATTLVWPHQRQPSFSLSDTSRPISRTPTLIPIAPTVIISPTNQETNSSTLVPSSQQSIPTVEVHQPKVHPPAHSNEVPFKVEPTVTPIVSSAAPPPSSNSSTRNASSIGGVPAVSSEISPFNFSSIAQIPPSPEVERLQPTLRRVHSAAAATTNDTDKFSALPALSLTPSGSPHSTYARSPGGVLIRSPASARPPRSSSRGVHFEDDDTKQIRELMEASKHKDTTPPNETTNGKKEPSKQVDQQPPHQILVDSDDEEEHEEGEPQVKELDESSSSSLAPHPVQESITVVQPPMLPVSITYPPSHRVRISLSCQNLPVSTTSDPTNTIIFVSMKSSSGEFVHLGQTEWIPNSRNPVYQTILEFIHAPRMKQVLKFVVYEVASYTPGQPMSESDRIGQVRLLLDHLILPDAYLLNPDSVIPTLGQPVPTGEDILIEGVGHERGYELQHELPTKLISIAGAHMSFLYLSSSLEKADPIESMIESTVPPPPVLVINDVQPTIPTADSNLSVPEVSAATPIDSITIAEITAPMDDRSKPDPSSSQSITLTPDPRIISSATEPEHTPGPIEVTNHAVLSASIQHRQPPQIESVPVGSSANFSTKNESQQLDLIQLDTIITQPNVVVNHDDVQIVIDQLQAEKSDLPKLTTISAQPNVDDERQTDQTDIIRELITYDSHEKGNDTVIVMDDATVKKIDVDQQLHEGLADESALLPPDQSQPVKDDQVLLSQVMIDEEMHLKQKAQEEVQPQQPIQPTAASAANATSILRQQPESLPASTAVAELRPTIAVVVELSITKQQFESEDEVRKHVKLDEVEPVGGSAEVMPIQSDRQRDEKVRQRELDDEGLKRKDVEVRTAGDGVKVIHPQINGSESVVDSHRLSENVAVSPSKKPVDPKKLSALVDDDVYAIPIGVPLVVPSSVSITSTNGDNGTSLETESHVRRVRPAPRKWTGTSTTLKPIPTTANTTDQPTDQNSTVVISNHQSNSAPIVDTPTSSQMVSPEPSILLVKPAETAQLARPEPIINEITPNATFPNVSRSEMTHATQPTIRSTESITPSTTKIEPISESRTQPLTRPPAILTNASELTSTTVPSLSITISSPIASASSTESAPATIPPPAPAPAPVHLVSSIPPSTLASVFAPRPSPTNSTFGRKNSIPSTSTTSTLTPFCEPITMTPPVVPTTIAPSTDSIDRKELTTIQVVEPSQTVFHPSVQQSPQVIIISSSSTTSPPIALSERTPFDESMEDEHTLMMDHTNVHRPRIEVGSPIKKSVKSTSMTQPEIHSTSDLMIQPLTPFCQPTTPTPRTLPLTSVFFPPPSPFNVQPTPFDVADSPPLIGTAPDMSHALPVPTTPITADHRSSDVMKTSSTTLVDPDARSIFAVANTSQPPIVDLFPTIPRSSSIPSTTVSSPPRLLSGGASFGPLPSQTKPKSFTIHHSHSTHVASTSPIAPFPIVPFSTSTPTKSKSISETTNSQPIMTTNSTTTPTSIPTAQLFEIPTQVSTPQRATVSQSTTTASPPVVIHTNPSTHTDTAAIPRGPSSTSIRPASRSTNISHSHDHSRSSRSDAPSKKRVTMADDIDQHQRRSSRSHQQHQTTSTPTAGRSSTSRQHHQPIDPSNLNVDHSINRSVNHSTNRSINRSLTSALKPTTTEDSSAIRQRLDFYDAANSSSASSTPPIDPRIKLLCEGIKVSKLTRGGLFSSSQLKPITLRLIRLADTLAHDSSTDITSSGVPPAIAQLRKHRHHLSLRGNDWCVQWDSDDSKKSIKDRQFSLVQYHLTMGVGGGLFVHDYNLFKKYSPMAGQCFSLVLNNDKSLNTSSNRPSLDIVCATPEDCSKWIEVLQMVS